MSRKEKALHGRDAGLYEEGRNDRADQSRVQDTNPTSFPKAFNADQHIRAARRAMSEAFIMLTGFPFRIRYTYLVGSDGKLIARAERRGEI
jgi:hypothetical protein